MFQCSYKKQNYLFRLIFFQWVIFGSSTITDFGWTLLYPTDHKCRLGWLSNCNLWTHAFSKWWKCNFSFCIPISIHLICRARSFSYLFLPHVQTRSSMDSAVHIPGHCRLAVAVTWQRPQVQIPSNYILLNNFSICSKWICYPLPCSAAGSILSS